MKMEHIKLAEEARAYKKCLTDMDEMRTAIHSASKLACSYIPNFQLYYLFTFTILIFFSLALVNQQVDLHEDLKIKFVEGAKERKELYNKVLELKGIFNFAVLC